MTKQKEQLVYLYYKDDSHGGDICEGQENDEWPNHEPQYRNFRPYALSVKEGDWVETIEVDFIPEKHLEDTVFVVVVVVVVVRFQDGDTFGTSYGNWHVVGAYLDEDKSVAIEDKIKSKKWKGNAPWESYFACLEDVEIHAFKLSDKIKKARYNIIERISK